MSKKHLGHWPKGLVEVAKNFWILLRKQWWWRANHSKSTRFNTQQGYYKQLRSNPPRDRELKYQCNMGISNKQFLHYQSVARQSLDKFRKIAHEKQVDAVYQLIESDWQAFIDDKERVRRYVDCVQGVGGILGFSRELRPRLSYEEILSRVAERFAELILQSMLSEKLGLLNLAVS